MTDEINSEQDLDQLSNQQFIEYLADRYRYARVAVPERPNSSQPLRLGNHERLYYNITRPVEGNYLKRSPIAELRSRQRRRKSESRLKKRRLRSDQYLQNELAENQNIFLSGQYTSSGEQMNIQNALWNKNYILKNTINELKEENNALRARAWNVSKENRKMKKQIDNWNLEKSLVTRENNKPYIDSTTMEKVYQDQDFSVVSMKIEIAQLTAILQEKNAAIVQEQQRLKSFDEEYESLESKVAVLAKQLFRASLPPNHDISSAVKQLHETVQRDVQRIKMLQSQIQQTRNTKQAYRYELEHLERPVRKYSAERASQIRKQNQLLMVEEKAVEPQKLLQNDIASMDAHIKNLEYKVQQLINEGILQKQNLRRQIRQAEAEQTAKSIVI